MEGRAGSTFKDSQHQANSFEALLEKMEMQVSKECIYIHEKEGENSLWSSHLHLLMNYVACH